MTAADLHTWTLDPDQAIQQQEQQRERLQLSWDDWEIQTIGGVDVNFHAERVSSAISLCHYPDLAQLSLVTALERINFPYIPGLLAFRVMPAILAAWERLPNKPDLLLVHGHGIAHPRGLGLASHLGLWLGIPTIGIARSLLFGLSNEVGHWVGDWTELHDEQDYANIVGAVLRTRAGAKPVYVSPGHLIDVENSVKFVLSACRGYRMPEPIRLAHQTAAAESS